MTAVATKTEFQESHGGVSKIQRYRWTCRNEPGELLLIRKHDLGVDHRYQRPLNDKKRLRIASNFNWAAFGVLIVSRRPDGELAVIDGQHRLAVAMSRSDIDMLPCVVFPMANIVDEATDFVVSNKERKPLTGVDTFRAQVVSGDRAAQIVERLVSMSGRQVAGHSGSATISCVRTAMKLADIDESVLVRIWPLVIEICRGNTIENRFVTGLFTVERRLLGADGRARSVMEIDNQRKLLEAGFSGVMREIGNATAYYSKGGDLVYARAILTVLNHKRRNKMTIKGDTVLMA